jgi:hypothetical protein
MAPKMLIIAVVLCKSPSFNKYWTIVSLFLTS